MVRSIIYQTQEGAQTRFEFQFNESVLFSQLPHVNVFDGGRLSSTQEKAVVVYSSNNLKVCVEFLNYLNKIKDHILFHCSNESLNHLTGYYKRAKAVLRSGGWNPNITWSNVYSVPLAFQSEFYNAHPERVTFENRRYAWCFFGSLKGDREEMYDCFKSIGPNYHFQSKGWMDPDNKTPAQVIEYYKDMVFIPSPVGNIYFECNRTMDALEWGCIPVSVEFLGEDCYKYLYGDHPFIIGKDWQDATRKMNELLNDSERLHIKQQEVWFWYNDFKKQSAQDVASIVNGEYDKIQGKQFQYQRQARDNWKLKWRFFKHFTLSVYWNRLLGKAKKATLKNGYPNICLLIADITRSGGTERAVVNLANDLSGFGSNITIVSIFSNKGNAFYNMDANIQIQHLGVYFQPNLAKRIFIGFKQLYASLKALYKSRNETIFIATDPFVSFVMARVHTGKTGNALVVCEHMALLISKFYSIWFRKLFLKKIDAVVVLTERDLEFVRQILPQVKSVVIPNRLSFVPEVLTDCQLKVILSVGRLEAQKNYSELIEMCEPILREYPDWSLVIVGGGSQEKELKDLIAKTTLIDQIQIVGPTRQIADYFFRSSIYVMSSIYEGFPMVLLEAKSYGLPIVSFDCPNGPREMIHGGKDGFLIKMHDHVGLRNALKSLMDNPMQRIEYGKKGSEDVRLRYSKEDIIIKWQNLLEII